MRVLVTGGAGRIGVDVCKKLLQNGFEVRVFAHDTPRTRKRIKILGGKTEVAWGDLTDIDSLRQAMEGVDAVVHTAAILPPACNDTPELARRVNVDGTRNIADLIKEKGGNIPFIYTSTEAVFGLISEATEPISPEKDATNPKGVYPETKLEGERQIKEAGVDCVILRLTTGWQLTLSKKDRQQMFRIPLDTRVEICCREDGAQAILSAIQNFDAVKGNILMVSSGANGRIRHRDRIRGFLKTMGLPMPSESKFGSGLTNYNWFDTSKAEELLPFKRATFDDFLKEYRKDMAYEYSPLFLPLMRYFIGPIFGWLIIRFF